VVSPAERARATWTIAAAELAAPPPVRLEERAYAASGEALLRLVQELPDAVGTAALVGHNPGLEDLLEILTGRWLRMPTSAIAVLTLSRAWADVGPSTADLETAGRPPAP
jgi:phosphohistidine phosphatase